MIASSFARSALPVSAAGPTGATLRQWPDGLDASIIGLFFLLALGLPAVGYLIAVLDFRRYLRSLRRALVLVLQRPTSKPYWAMCDRPACLETLGLRRPFTEEEVLAAYREKVKTLHPDRGGEMRAFLQLQRHFEQARRLASDGKTQN